MRIFESQKTGVVLVVLQHGEDLLRSIRLAARETGTHTGVLLSGIGSLRKGRIHTVSTNDLPPENLFIDLPGPLEISNYTGIVAHFEPHVHITLMDGQGKVHGGHLEEGCEVLTLAELSILKIPDLALERVKSTGDLFPMLGRVGASGQ
jgi:predicted DNA-binding protein with PD1-like motif